MTVNVDAGDAWAEDGDVFTLPSDGSGSQGDVVKFNASAQVTPTTATGDAVAGVLAEDSPASAGDNVSVRLHGAVAVTADGAISAGDVVQPSGTTNGHVVTGDTNEGVVTAVDEGGTATYDIYSRYMIALEDAADGEVFKVLLS